MKRLINSPLKVLALLSTLFGLTVAIWTLGYLIVLGLIFIGIGLLVYLIDYLCQRWLLNNRIFWTTQYLFTMVYITLAFVAYMKWQEHNAIVFPKNFKGQAGIIFGIEGYPELPKTKLWKKTITIPENGLIITSTREEEVPNTIRFSFAGNSSIDYNLIDWDPNFELDCITSKSKIKSWLFQIGSYHHSPVKAAMTELCNQIATNQKRSLYTSESPVIWSDDKGRYLWLQNKGLTTLPVGLSKLDIYKAILTGNNFTEVPQQVFEISSLEELILAANPVSTFPCELQKLKWLKSISFAETNIKDINCDLSNLDSLKDFDLSRNSLTKLPDQIKTIPNLTWLSLNDNLFTDLSFVDRRLGKLEVLYLYTNRVKSLSKETRHLSNLKELLIFDNEIDSIPDNIADLKSLEKLEIWNNPIKYVSPEISKLKALKTIRLDDDYLTQADKDNLRKWLPDCQINYQTRREKKNAL